MSNPVFGNHMDMCRACLVIISHDEGYSLLENSLAMQFIECSSLAVDQFDVYPKCICEQCYEILQRFHLFQEMCVESAENFKNLLIEEMMLTDISQLNNNEEKKCEKGLMMGGTGDPQRCDKKMTFEKKHHLSYSKTITSHICEESANSYLEINNGHDTGCISKQANAKGSAKNRKVYCCHDCPKKFYKQERLQAHLRTHRGLKPHTCSICCATFTRVESLRAHTERQHEMRSQRYQCTFAGCSKSYTNKDYLRVHTNVQHNSATAIRKNLLCEICGKIFNRSNLFSRHRYLHLDKSRYPFSCSHCDKRFYTKQFLEQHLFRHVGVKLFTCPHCTVGKFTKAELDRHMNVHKRQNSSHQCTVCSKHFTTSSNLKLHIRAVHECFRPYVCKFCDQRFARALTLKNHELRHSDARPYKCHLCERTFLQQGVLNTHIRRIHNMDPISRDKEREL